MSVGESLIFAGKSPERQEYFLGVYADLVFESNNPGTERNGQSRINIIERIT
jgi:hypothetical protein